MIDENVIDTEAVGCWFERNVFKLTPYKNGYRHWMHNTFLFKKKENFVMYCFEFIGNQQDFLDRCKNILKENPNWVFRSIELKELNLQKDDTIEILVNVWIPDEDILLAYDKMKNKEEQWQS